ncbi:MAG: SAM-dependent methyltransferase, FkbM family [Gammaproteobacteria bacterium]|nr:SAM-dependent methyltransferase, FkbM family [Gammaproteobacteria bacterium]
MIGGLLKELAVRIGQYIRPDAAADIKPDLGSGTQKQPELPSVAAAATRTTTVEIAGGVRVVVPNSLDLITPYVLFEQQDWFEDELGFLRRTLRPGQNAIDIGANYGVYTLSIANAVGPTGGVWAFEPSSSTAALLAQGIAANGFSNVVLETSAVSNKCGQAQLTLSEHSELNALVQERPLTGNFETVNVVTLDECLQRYDWRDIALLKIDAEGEEAHIIAGGRDFLAKLSPLILYEVKAGDDLHLELVGKFAECGYRSFRLVVGPDLLVPFDSSSVADGYLLNLFCCKDDTAARLAERGLLLDSAALDAPDAAQRVELFFREHAERYGWRKKLVALPYGAALADVWETAQSSDDAVAVNEALARFAISQDTSLDPLTRFSALDSSFRSLQSLCSQRPQFLRLASLARVAREHGSRAVAVSALSRLVETIVKENRVNVGEPFLAPGKAFESIAPREDVGKWALAALLEELERLNSFSSFYTGNSARSRLDMIASLGFSSAEMSRRLQLVQLRFPKAT